jgi:hypothetical protein
MWKSSKQAFDSKNYHRHIHVGAKFLSWTTGTINKAVEVIEIHTRFTLSKLMPGQVPSKILPHPKKSHRYSFTMDN